MQWVLPEEMTGVTVILLTMTEPEGLLTTYIGMLSVPEAEIPKEFPLRVH